MQKVVQRQATKIVPTLKKSELSGQVGGWQLIA